MDDLTHAFDGLAAKISEYGIRVLLERMDLEVPGRFDGTSITINSAHGSEARCFYLAHSFGSIVAWSVDFSRARRVFDELRDAKKSRDPQRLERAIDRFSEFEEVASQYAVWFLADTGHKSLIDGYTLFFRADVEAMQHYHREGVAPRWPDFFARWKASASRGEKSVRPYTPRPIPPFTLVTIREQEVVQERDGKPG